MPTPLLTQDNLAPPAPDFVSLNTRLRECRTLQMEMMKTGFIPDPNLPEEVNAKGALAFAEQLRNLINEQLTILAALRGTAINAGPAKAGGKRAKRAPIDLASLEDGVY